MPADSNPSSPFRLDREAETSPRRLALIAGGGAVAVALTLWLFSGGEEAASPPPPAPAAMPAPAPPPAPVPPPPPAPAISPAQLTLHGVLGHGEDGAAIIAVGGAQRLVRVGREVVPGLPLVAVAADHVVLRERGQDVRLSFPVGGGGSTVTPVPGGSARGTGSADAETLRREAMEYQLGLEVDHLEGSNRGFRIRPGAVPPAFARAGLQPGDVVIRVGGRELESPEDVEQIPRALRGAESVQIVFVRDGRRRTINFQRP